MLKNFSYTFLSNVVSFFISAVITLIVPKFLGVESYSYYQLYIFYISYSGFLHLGWIDGIFLRFGGEYYENLNQKSFSGQFYLFCLMQIIIGIIIINIGFWIFYPYEKAWVIILTGVAIMIQLPCKFFQYILQMTNRIKEYATLTIIEKTISVMVVFIWFILQKKSFIFIIIADLVGKLSALFYVIYQCKNIVLTKPVAFMQSFYEMVRNISVGIKLMISNIASMMIIGFVRLSIENQWSVTTFGKVSLTMSISNLLMIFIRAVAMIMFPALKRIDKSKLADIYCEVEMGLEISLLGLLILYYPFKFIMSLWLPQYADSLVYMALLFPICLYESKMSMLIETYMKVLRQEKELLKVNVLMAVLTVVTTGISAYWKKNLDLTVALIVFLLAIRCIFAEIILTKSLKVSVKKEIFLEISMTIIFIYGSWNVTGIRGIAIYFIAYIGYLLLNKNELLRIFNKVINWRKSML